MFLIQLLFSAVSIYSKQQIIMIMDVSDQLMENRFVHVQQHVNLRVAPGSPFSTNSIKQNYNVVIELKVSDVCFFFFFPFFLLFLFFSHVLNLLKPTQSHTKCCLMREQQNSLRLAFGEKHITRTTSAGRQIVLQHFSHFL